MVFVCGECHKPHPTTACRSTRTLCVKIKMNISDVKEILDRVNRLSERAKTIKGAGSSWSHRFEDGTETTYILNEVKPGAELEDDILNVFIWLWNMKDYFKSVLKARGDNPETIENKINADVKLTVCADIANGIKHGSLKGSRSGLFPKLGPLSYSIPGESMTKLEFRGNEIEMDFKEFENIEIKMPVIDHNNKQIYDALPLIQHALSKWAGIYESL